MRNSNGSNPVYIWECADGNMTSNEYLDREIGDLIKRLFSENSLERTEARQRLVKIGKPVIPFLVGLQYLNDQCIAREAIKTLSEIAHPDAIPILVNGIENNDPNIRWLAAEGLIKIGEPSLMPVLEALEMHAGSKSLREAVCHILRFLKEEGVFIDKYGLIGMLRNHARQMLVAPTAAMIHMNL
jgi:hypothetical protein